MRFHVHFDAAVGVAEVRERAEPVHLFFAFVERFPPNLLDVAHVQLDLVHGGRASRVFVHEGVPFDGDCPQVLELAHLLEQFQVLVRLVLSQLVVA